MSSKIFLSWHHCCTHRMVYGDSIYTKVVILDNGLMEILVLFALVYWFDEYTNKH